MPFVFQHGMGAEVNQPLSLGAKLRGWCMIAMDCRGHGQTEANLEPARISFAQFAEDLAALLDSLNLKRAVVGGISIGAGVALAFALAHPKRVAGLILVRPAWLDRPDPSNLRWFPLVARLLREFSAEEAARRFEQSPDFSELQALSKPATGSLLGQFRRSHARERAVILTQMPASAPMKSLEECQQLQIPTLVVVNARDPVHPDTFGHQLAAAIPGAALTRITSKTESETLHQIELERTLKDFLQPIQEQLTFASAAGPDVG